MKTIVPDIITYLKDTLEYKVVIDSVGNSKNHFILVSHLSYNRDYTDDALETIIDETISILVKRDNLSLTRSVAENIKSRIIGNTINDTRVSISDCHFIGQTPIELETKESYYTILNFRFIGAFK